MTFRSEPRRQGEVDPSITWPGDPRQADLFGRARQHGDVVTEIEQLLAEKAEIDQRIRGVYAAARADRLDLKTVRAILRLRRLNHATRDQAGTVGDLLRTILGLE